MLTKEEVLKIAKLARLELSDSEVTKYQKELSSILDYFETLSDLDTSGVEPIYQVTGLQSVTRRDSSSDSSLDFSSCSPSIASNGSILVKNVL